MVRLRRSDTSRPGLTRVPRGRGFQYLDPAGQRPEPEALQRIRDLVIPPAWKDVWICPWPNGHIQAIGTDSAGRRQYRYHDAWREHRDREKFDRVLRFARALPELRATVARDLQREGLDRERVLATAVRLLDRGCFRIGTEQYAEEHETFGIATLRKEHVAVRGQSIVFDYPAKGSIRRVVRVEDDEARAVVAALKRRRGAEHLLAYREGRRWVEVESSDVNAYIKAAAGEDYTAKDFRTWSGTVLTATLLAEPRVRASSRTATKRAVSSVVKAVAEHLGNTPAVCRSSYVDPRVIDRFGSGETIAGTLERLGPLPPDDGLGDLALRDAVDRAVVALIEEEEKGSRAA